MKGIKRELRGISTPPVKALISDTAVVLAVSVAASLAVSFFDVCAEEIFCIFGLIFEKLPIL